METLYYLVAVICQYSLGSYKVQIKDFEGFLLLFHLVYTKQTEFIIHT